MTTYQEVGKSAGLGGKMLERFLEYMRARWSGEEILQCQTGYATEWALRFKRGTEYQNSDRAGQAVLKQIDNLQYD